LDARTRRSRLGLIPRRKSGVVAASVMPAALPRNDIALEKRGSGPKQPWHFVWIGPV